MVHPAPPAPLGMPLPLHPSQRIQRPALAPLFALPWCCVVPVLVSLTGLGSAAVGNLLRPFNLLFLTSSVLLVGWSNYRVHTHPSSVRAKIWVGAATAFSGALWMWSLNLRGWQIV